MEPEMSNAQDIEFGLDSFVPISVDETGRELSGEAVSYTHLTLPTICSV